MRRLRSFSFILSIVTAISLVCIGFSSWTITGTGVTGTFGGGVINSFPVINVEEYVQFDTSKGENNSGIECFKFYANGFLNSDNLHSPKATITVHYVLIQSACFAKFGDTITLEFHLRGTYEDNGALKEIDTDAILYAGIAVNVEDGTANITNYYQGNETHLIDICQFSDLTENGSNIKFSVVYTFDMDDWNTTDFANAYRILNSNAQFYAHARVSGTNVAVVH